MAVKKINKKTSVKKKALKKKVSVKSKLLKKSSKTKVVKKKNLRSKKKDIKKKKPRKKIVSKKLTKKTLIKKSIKIKKRKRLVKKQSLKTTANKEHKVRKKREKKIINFDDYLKGIVTKLIEKHKIDGVYTSKIIEKGVPKKFRIPENVLKVEEFLKQNNFTILSEAEASELLKASKEDTQSSTGETEA